MERLIEEIRRFLTTNIAGIPNADLYTFSFYSDNQLYADGSLFIDYQIYFEDGSELVDYEYIRELIDTYGPFVDIRGRRALQNNRYVSSMMTYAINDRIGVDLARVSQDHITREDVYTLVHHFEFDAKQKRFSKHQDD
jgi:hypothetical protein